MVMHALKATPLLYPIPCQNTEENHLRYSVILSIHQGCFVSIYQLQPTFFKTDGIILEVTSIVKNTHVQRQITLL